MDKEWHLRKEVTVGNILTSVLAIVAALSAFYNLDKRVLTNSAHIQANAERIAEGKETQKADKDRIMQKLDRIENILLENARDKK